MRIGVTPGWAAEMLHHARRRAVLLLALLQALASPLLAQQSAERDADASRLRLGVDSLAIYVVRGGDTIRTGTQWDELRVEGTGEAARLLRIYRSRDAALGLRVDTIIDRYPDLRPLRHVSQSTRGAELLEFAADEARGWRRAAGGDSVAVRIPLPPAAIAGATFDLMIRSSPLADGWTTEVEAIVAGSPQPVHLTAGVAGSEIVGGEETWRVEADFMGTAVTFWVGKETRRLRRQVMQLGEGLELLFGPFPVRPAPPSRAA